MPRTRSRVDRDSRAHHGQSKINSRLCSLGNFDPDECGLPPKPKWMRWRTYNRYEQKFDQYEAQLNAGLEKLGRQAEVGLRSWRRFAWPPT
jgi:hypothetical protein